MNPARSFAVFAIVVALTVVARTQTSQRSGDPSLPQLLAAAARYVDNYEKSFGALIAEENYRQSQGGFRRNSIGDILLFNSGSSGWMAFRDLHLVDAVTLPGRPGRLAELASTPTPELLAEAMRSTEAAARFTLGTLPRSAVVPVTGLTYLRSERQPFCKFEFDEIKTVDDVRAAVVKFSEQTRARMTSADDSTTTGRFWIEPVTGNVVQTEVTIASPTYEMKVEVKYARQPGVDILVPVRMYEQHTQYFNADQSYRTSPRIGSGATRAVVDGIATYQSFRRFDLKPGLTIR